MKEQKKGRWKVVKEDKKVLIDFLADKTSLSKSLLKKVMAFGGVWVTPTGKNFKGERRRVRRSSYEMEVGHTVEIFYDPKLLEIHFDPCELLVDDKEFGIWCKPAGVLAQGNDFGDEGSLLRVVEKERERSFLIHRLDREVGGLTVVAYTHKAAAQLSAQFQQRKVEKKYQAIVLGVVGTLGQVVEINASLEGKSAQSFVRVLRVSEGHSWVEVEITTGRKHQIRRHLDILGHPVMGDPQYGRRNKNQSGLKLWASFLRLDHPFKKMKVEKELPPPQAWEEEWESLSKPLPTLEQ